ncbi:hypothetical protein ACSSV1_000758 [Labrenzia sp. MBR-25]
MANARQKQLLLDLFESLPSIVFILLWRQTSDLELAGWTGCGLAAFVLAGFVLLKARMHPVLLGINLHILLVTPLLVGFFRFGDRDLAEFLTGYSYSAVLLTVTITGGVLTLFSRGGFVGVPGLPRYQRHRLSLLMLAVSLAGAVWACWAPDNSIFPVVATLTLLIGGRRFLIAGLSEKSANGVMLAPVLAGASDTTNGYT